MPCPACGQHDTLIALGTRLDRPYRWRPWMTALTHLYLCDRCEALVELGEKRTPMVETVPVPGGRAARRYEPQPIGRSPLVVLTAAARAEAALPCAS